MWKVKEGFIPADYLKGIDGTFSWKRRKQTLVNKVSPIAFLVILNVRCE